MRKKKKRNGTKDKFANVHRAWISLPRTVPNALNLSRVQTIYPIDVSLAPFTDDDYNPDPGQSRCTKGLLGRALKKIPRAI